MNAELTTQDFWDSYWGKLKLPSLIDENFSFERCIAIFLRQNSSILSKSGKILEIGAAPGKWLAFFENIGEYTLSGIEYSKPGSEFLKKNLSILNLKVDKIYTGDFFEINPVPEFDIVMSYGFIEHFAEPYTVMEKHLNWLKPGGTMIIGIPNFRHTHGWFQKILKKEILDIHNVNIMNISFFQEAEHYMRVKLKKVEYIGGFEPDLIICDPKLTIKNFIPRLILKVFKIIRKFRFFDRFNNKFVSSYIIAIFEKSE